MLIQKEEFISYGFDKSRNTQFLYSIIASENSLSVQHFEPRVKEKCHSLNKDIFPVFPQDMGEKVSPPKIVKKENFINTTTTSKVEKRLFLIIQD